MGYTHYWTFKKNANHNDYRTALKDCRKIIKRSPIPLGNAYGKKTPLLNCGIALNGVGEDNHESFILPRTLGTDDFCKTDRKPYDVIVTACLCILYTYMKDSIAIQSDGDPHEWEPGRHLAQIILQREIDIPQNVIDQVNMYGWYATLYRKQHPEYKYTSIDITHPNRASESIPSNSL